MATAALGLTRRASGVYFTPNPVDPELLTRCPNRVDRYSKSIGYSLTTDDDILERRYLLIDLDPDRIDTEGELIRTKCPSTDAELQLAVEAADAVELDFVFGLKWQRPLRMCSGNGIHLLFPLSKPIPPTLPEYEEDPIRHVFRVYGDWRYQNRVAFDANTHTASRMLKVPGTWAKKGTTTADRPYRRAEILTVPTGWSVPERASYDRSEHTTSTADSSPGDPTHSRSNRVATASSEPTSGGCDGKTARNRRRNRSESGSLFERTPGIGPGSER
jgi:hypothetical protein